MHECTSIIINSFHLFQQTLFNRGFQGFPYWGVHGGAPPIQRFFSKPLPTSKLMPPHGATPFKNMNEEVHF